MAVVNSFHLTCMVCLREQLFNTDGGGGHENMFHNTKKYLTSPHDCDPPPPMVHMPKIYTQI